ncbi:enoyl-CoA hydratase-related protein [Chitinophaga sedimenti]|uniref:enoyl-CoA hydratase-related protein n=1 Tax=Chitinophaga sedimenti TaxID=2033606 RepID=UPI00249D9540|nr:enoyl-CoA hydratase-related protein [Chitinophaga sedimenti]
MFKTLEFTVADGIATITLNRPEVYNAFDDTLSYELQDALKQADKDAAVRAVVLTGAGKALQRPGFKSCHGRGQTQP